MSKVAHCHKLIAETAKEMAHAVYDELMQRNDWYSDWKEQNTGLAGKALEEKWVRHRWGLYIESARATLAGMLRGPLDIKAKDEIMEALTLDSTLVRGRAQGGQTLLRRLN